MDEWLASACAEAGERSLLSPASDCLDILREIANALVVDKSLFSDATATQSVSSYFSRILVLWLKKASVRLEHWQARSIFLKKDSP